MSAADHTSNLKVHLGFWTNWEYGNIRGATITLTNGSGKLFIAFIALFITVVGTSFWRIMCFGLHFALSSDKPQHALYHQRQAILRNSATGWEGFRSFSQSLWSWRKAGRHVLPYLLLPNFLAIMCSILFAVAGVFSSRIVKATGSRVLLRSSNCGMPSLVRAGIDGSYKHVKPLYSTKVSRNFNYALQCYTGGSDSGNCGTFVKPFIPITVQRNASCPFGERVCQTNNTNLILDTGYLDSLKDLGVNTRQEDRFLYRRKYHCAPLKTDGFREISNEEVGKVGRYYYGETLVSTTLGYNVNFTYQYPWISTYKEINATLGWVPGPKPDYAISCSLALRDPENPGSAGNTSDSQFWPVDLLQVNSSDTLICFLSTNAITFSQPSNDPWFTAHSPGTPIYTVGSNESRPSYEFDEPGRAIACTAQDQYCNPNFPENSRCTPVQGTVVWNLFETGSNVWLTERHINIMNWALKLMKIGPSRFESAVSYLGVSALTAKFRLFSGIQAPLPSNQWQLEMEHWFNTSLAALQADFVNTAAGPLDPVILNNNWLIRPNLTEEHVMCSSQMINSALHSSFSVLALSLILIIGGLIIILSHALEYIGLHLGQRSNANVYDYLEWTSNSTLQLQRLAHEAIGYGAWERVLSANPITKSVEEKLSMLDISDPKHPVLTAMSHDATNNITPLQIVENKRS